MNGATGGRPQRAGAAAPSVFRNRVPAYLWGFTAAWCTVLLIITVLLLREGPPAGWSLLAAAALAAVFWYAGAGLLLYSLRKPCSVVTLVPGEGVVVELNYPFRTTRRRHRFADLPPPQLVEDRDGDGNPYYFVRLGLPDGVQVDVTEGLDRAECERIRAALRDQW